MYYFQNILYSTHTAETITEMEPTYIKLYLCDKLTIWRPKFIYIIYNNLVLTSQRTLRSSNRKANWWIF